MYYNAQVVSVSDYYPFGMGIKEREWKDSSFSYRFGFNGYERVDEVAGEGAVIDFGARVYDSRLGRFFSTDPLMAEYSWQSPYVFAANSPIVFIDILGLGPVKPKPNLINIYTKTIFGAVKEDAQNEASVLFIQNKGYNTDPNDGYVTGDKIDIPYVKQSTAKKIFDGLRAGYGGGLVDPNTHSKRITHTKDGNKLFTFELRVMISPLSEYNSVAKIEMVGEVKGSSFAGDLDGKFVVAFRAPKPDGQDREGRIVAMMVFDTEEDYNKFHERREEIRNDELLKLAEGEDDPKYRKKLVDYYKKNYKGTKDSNTPKKQDSKKP